MPCSSAHLCSSVCTMPGCSALTVTFASNGRRLVSSYVKRMFASFDLHRRKLGSLIRAAAHSSA